MTRHLVPDDFWDAIAPHLPPEPPRTGQKNRSKPDGSRQGIGDRIARRASKAASGWAVIHAAFLALGCIMVCWSLIRR